MDRRWTEMKKLFASGEEQLSAEQRRALRPHSHHAGSWEAPRVELGSPADRPPPEPTASLPSTAPAADVAATWVVTAADAKFWDILTCFLGSLRDVALYTGRIAVLDYGLEAPQRQRLRESDVTIVEPYRRHALIIDRYLTVRDYFRGNTDDTVLYFDADIWFADSIGEVLASHGIGSGKLGAAKDVWYCDYYLKCSNQTVHPIVEEALGEVVRDYGQTLQAGFVAGSTRAWTRYANLLEAILTEGFAADQWGTDALALNLYAELYKNRFELLPITYNAPPLWGVVREGKRFFATNFATDSLYKDAIGRVPVRAIHCTSAVRHRKDLGLYFGDVYPEILDQWTRRLATH